MHLIFLTDGVYDISVIGFLLCTLLILTYILYICLCEVNLFAIYTVCKSDVRNNSACFVRHAGIPWCLTSNIIHLVGNITAPQLHPLFAVGDSLMILQFYESDCITYGSIDTCIVCFSRPPMACGSCSARCCNTLQGDICVWHGHDNYRDACDTYLPNPLSNIVAYYAIEPEFDDKMHTFQIKH